MTNYPYSFERTTTTDVLQARYSDLEPGAETTDEARIAGRVRTIRTHGKVGFADLEDGGGRLQLFAQQVVLGDDGLEQFSSLSVGDIVGAAGVVVRTKRGELSLKVAELVLLAPCRRPMPEKHKGMVDIEARYRQRYLDLLVNPDSRRFPAARMHANRAVRNFMEERGFVEVETPLLQPIASGATARPFVTHHNALDMDLYLRIAPELYLKRLLIGGLEKVYELNRSFRNEGVSSMHNVEFTMLEAYEAFVDYNTTMSLVEDLVRTIAEATDTMKPALGEEQIDLEGPFRRTTMFETIEEVTGTDLAPAWDGDDVDAIMATAEALGVEVPDGWPSGRVVAEIFEQRVERTIVQPTFVVGYPKEVSPLAKDHRSLRGFTEQADLIIAGTEMAPIYSELNDPEEQALRFQQQLAARAAGEEDVALPDEDFVEALFYAMPPAGGFGLGIDRLLTVLTEAGSMREVILFPIMRPAGS